MWRKKVGIIILYFILFLFYFFDIYRTCYILEISEQQFGDCLEALVYCLQTGHKKMVLRFLFTSETKKTFPLCKMNYGCLTSEKNL